jgi:enoyl-CoA hydratase/carnithine racemase
MAELVVTEVKNHIAHVKLNRPGKYNALSPQMFEAIVDAGRRVASDTTIRAVVLSGEGPGFCAGLDFESFMELGSGDMAAAFARAEGSIANFAQLPAYIWKQAPVPVIAALHGAAYGGGLQLALGADIRLACPTARFSVREIRWGLVPDMSGTQTLRDLVRLDVAKELVFTGRVVAAEEAARIGLITRVCEDPLVEAQALAGDIAVKSPHTIAADKKLLEEAWHGPSEAGLALESSLQRTLIGTPNQLEAVMANFEKRAANFADRD